jgi:hypothetical protein
MWAGRLIRLVVRHSGKGWALAVGSGVQARQLL